jgi:hypothetical protein
MANISQPAGGGGVSGRGAPGAVTGAYDTAYTANGNLAVAGSNAVRRSVSQTSGCLRCSLSPLVSAPLMLVWKLILLHLMLPALVLD